MNAGGSGAAQSSQASKNKKQKQAAEGAVAAAVAVSKEEVAQATPQPASTVRYSPLHHNIEEFCTKVVPTDGEKRQRMEVIEA